MIENCDVSFQFLRRRPLFFIVRANMNGAMGVSCAVLEIKEHNDAFEYVLRCKLGV